MAVRSRRLWGPITVPTGGAQTALYTVPAGRTAVIRGLFVKNDTGLANTCALIINTAGMYGFSFANNQQALVLPEELVLNPGDQLKATATLTVQITGCGSLLEGAPS